MELDKARIYTAMVTPFNEQKEIDNDRLEKLIDYLLSNGTEGILVGGTTGESPTLTFEEKLALYRKTVTFVDGRAPIIAGTGSNNTAETILFTKEVEKIKGIDGVLVVAPYYNKPNQKGLYEHFKAVAETTKLPVILYNVPGRTSVSIDPQTTIRLSKIENIKGIKECAGLEAVSEIIEQTNDQFLVYSGEDGSAFHARCLGGNGIISVASHALGKDMQEMYNLIDDGSLSEAAAMHRNLLPKMNSLFSVPSPAPSKMYLNSIGVKVGSVRLPLVDCTSEEKNNILSTIQ